MEKKGGWAGIVIIWHDYLRLVLAIRALLTKLRVRSRMLAAILCNVCLLPVEFLMFIRYGRKFLFKSSLLRRDDREMMMSLDSKIGR